MSKKLWVLFGALTLIVALALAACGTGAATTEAPAEETEAATEAPPPERETEDTIVVCMNQEPDSQLMHVTTMFVSGQVAQGWAARGWFPDRAFFFETQMLVNDEFPTIENGGAVIDESTDQLVVTFQFKPEITWSDGEPFTVDDLIFTRDVMLDPDSGASSTGTLATETWTKIDDHTLQVAYAPGARPPTYYLPSLTGPTFDNGNVLPQHVLEGMAPADMITSDFARQPDPVLGPYHIVEWVSGSHIRLEAVDNWWGGEVRTPNLIYAFIPDVNTLLASVVTGACDYATSDGLSLSQLPTIQEFASEGRIQYEAIPGTTWEHIDFNTWPVEPGGENDNTPFFADARVRQAVAYGTNRLGITEDLLFGEVEPLNSFLPADHWAYNPEVDGLYPFDPDQARAILAEAGWEDSDGDGVVEAQSDLSGDYSCNRGPWTVPAGTKFEVAYHSTQSYVRPQLMAVFQSNMADIGISILLEPLPASVWFADDGPLYHRTYQIGEFAWVSTADPSNATSTYVGENIYSTPDGQFLAAGTIVEQNPDLLADTGISEFDFRHRRPAAEDLPEGYALFYEEQISSAEDNYTGQNNLGWCNTAASEAMFNGGNELANSDRLPYYLEVQRQFAADLPSLPLFQRVNVEAFVPGLCGVDLGPSNLATWNVETWVLYSDGGACE